MRDLAFFCFVVLDEGPHTWVAFGPRGSFVLHAMVFGNFQIINTLRAGIRYIRTLILA